MLKRIGRHEVRLGMFIERIHGNWLDHPFWRSKFVMDDPADLARLQASTIEFVIVDEARSLPATPVPRPARAPARPPAFIPAEEAMRQYRKATGQLFADARLGRRLDVARSSKIVVEITRSLDVNPDAILKLTRLKSIDAYTYTHSVAVSTIMVAFARHLALDEAEIHELGVAGLMHDIGKVAISPAILTKASTLSDHEIEIVRRHPVDGHDLVKAGAFSDVVLDVTRHHHEKIDGSGYPDALAGEAISRPARIAAICDVYDAVTSLRPYKRAWSSAEALTQMARWHGHFDRELLVEFAALLGLRKMISLDGGEGAVPDDGALPFLENGFSDPTNDPRGIAPPRMQDALRHPER